MATTTPKLTPSPISPHENVSAMLCDRACSLLVAEVVADTQDRGVLRHPVRFARLRLDAAVEDVPAFGAGAASSPS